MHLHIFLSSRMTEGLNYPGGSAGNEFFLSYCEPIVGSREMAQSKRSRNRPGKYENASPLVQSTNIKDSSERAAQTKTVIHSIFSRARVFLVFEKHASCGVMRRADMRSKLHQNIKSDFFTFKTLFKKKYYLRTEIFYDSFYF